MADSRKLQQRSAMIVAALDRISTLITDDGAREEELEVFRNAGIKVMIAQVSEEDTQQKLA
jgi:DeoR family ulaG and ulaABCDEF operon transcriptional repressor